MDKKDGKEACSAESEPVGLEWRKARLSSYDGQCVEVASTSGMVVIRDSKDPDGPILVYKPVEFNTFLRRVGKGVFDNLMRYTG